MNIIDQFFGHESANLFQFIKYGISGCIATSTHILVFHLAAWKLFSALQADDWFVRILNLPIQELDVTTRSRNSMKGNGVGFLIYQISSLILLIFTGFLFPAVIIGSWKLACSIWSQVLAIVIGTGLMGFLIRRFGMLTTYAFGANIFAALMINYAMRKFFIFNG